MHICVYLYIYTYIVVYTGTYIRVIHRWVIMLVQVMARMVENQ